MATAIHGRLPTGLMLCGAIRSVHLRTREPLSATDDPSKITCRACIRIIGAPWRPIQRAPRDGTPILLWIPSDRNTPCKGYWDRSLGTWLVASRTVKTEPTHWMPLVALEKKP
jgi:hypothetical protein